MHITTGQEVIAHTQAVLYLLAVILAYKFKKVEICKLI
jgi:hypothetical protein